MAHTHSYSIVSRLIVLVGCCAAWGSAPIDALAQGASSAATSLHTWRRTSQGLSPNAALARYRMQNLGHSVPRSFALRQPAIQPTTTLYSTPYYAITTHRTIPARPTSYYPTTNSAATGSLTPKPFADLQRPPTAVQRYWPYLLEAREDPRTGLVIWQLP